MEISPSTLLNCDPFLPYVTIKRRMLNQKNSRTALSIELTSGSESWARGTVYKILAALHIQQKRGLGKQGYSSHIHSFKTTR